MNWKPTLVLLAVAAAFYAYFALYENKQPGTRELGQNSGVVFAYDRNQVDALIVTNHDTKIDLSRGEANHWKMTAPVTDRADGPLIEEVLTTLESMRKVDTISAGYLAKVKLADYGLQTPREKLAVTDNVSKKGHVTEFLFGNESPIDGKVYLQVTGGGDVFVVNDDLKKLLQKDVNSWRDHRLTNLLATDVTKLVVKNPAGEIELQRDADHWKLVKPLAARADDAKVNDLVSQVATLNVKSFVADDKADAASYGLTEPRGTVTLYTAKDPKGTEVMIGGSAADPAKASPAPSPAASPAATPDPKLADTVYARMPARQSVYAVPNTINAFVSLKPNDLRDLHLVRLNTDLVDRIKITPAGGAAFTLGRKDKVWSMVAGSPTPAPAVDPTAPDRVLQTLTNATVTEFVTDSASDLAKYGLDKPALQVTFSSFASENTAESSAGDKPIATVSFGKTEDGHVYAKVEDEPFVVSVPPTLLTDIPADPLAWQPLSIFQADPDKVTSLEIKANDRPDLALTRPEKGAWTLPNKGAGDLNASKAQSVANVLARLRALRWVGVVKPGYGLDAPVETLTFSTSGEPKITGRLLLGKATPEGMHYAQADGKQGVFLLSQPDYEVLSGPLVPLPTPAPTPTAVPSPAATPAASPVTTPTPEPTAAPATPAPTPMATSTPATPEPTPTQAPTAAPKPMATPEPTPVPTTTPEPTPMATPEATPTPTAAMTPEPTLTATATPMPSVVATPSDIPAATPTP